MRQNGAKNKKAVPKMNFLMDYPYTDKVSCNCQARQHLIQSIALLIFACPSGGMADALASGASARKGVEVRLLSWAPEVFNMRMW